MTHEEWLVAISHMKARWPRSDIPDETYQLWYTDLENCTVEEVVDAIQTHQTLSDSGQFPPTSGEILRIIIDKEIPHGYGSGVSWRVAMDAVHKYGIYREEEALDRLREEDPITGETVRLFGWRELCHYDYGDESTIRAQYRRVYDGVAHRFHYDATVKRLPGAKGPRAIGDITKAVIGDGGDRRG
jgi:hypothetical protein